MRRRMRKGGPEPQELNITAFMNLMVVLVPFLLMMVVFSRITILELSMPQGVASGGREPPLPLEIIVRADRLLLADQAGGRLTEIPNVDGDYDLPTLASALRKLKAAAPERRQATLLLEPEVDYERLVSIMDTVRVVPTTAEDGRVSMRELFPEVSLGDAPAAQRRS